MTIPPSKKVLNSPEEEKRIKDQNLISLLNRYISKRSYAELAKILQEVIAVHVDWDLDFCELNAALIKFEMTQRK